MTLRAKILLYLAILHLALATVSLLWLWDQRAWLLAVEASLVASGVAGYRLVASFFTPVELIRDGAESLSAQDFASHLRPSGQPELDDLVRVYNQMVDRLRSEREALAQQHFVLDRVLDASPAGVLTLDYDGRVSLVNPSAESLLEVDAEAARGKLLDELEGPLAAALAAMEAGSSRVLSLGRRRLKCSRASFYDRGFPRSLFVLQELTEELRASERDAYRTLIRLMSHEVNNSVAAVTSLLESCRDYGAQLEPADREDFLGALGVTGARMESLASFMRGFAEVVRLPAPERRPCGLAALVRDVVTLLAPELERRRIRCVWDREEPVEPLSLDKNQIEQVLLNVLRNSLEAIGEDGEIGLALAGGPDGATLRVRDTGGGLPAGQESRVFTPFFSTKKDGRGLGLLLVQEILSRHGCDFQLANRPGTGCELRIRFPSP